MATIGLYDIDFNHDNTFSISLPLMKAYRKLSQEGHKVIMMKPYENTGRYNKIFYFKEGNVKIPKGLTINSEKGKTIGYGFYGCSNLMKETLETPPDFTPYEMNIDRVKNKVLFNSIKNNSLISWRDKDFTGVRNGAGITYIADRDFMENYDWEEVFDHFDNNINFIHTLRPNEEQLPILIQKNYTKARIIAPLLFDEKLVLEMLDTKGILFDDKQISFKKLLGFILFVKTFTNKTIPFYFTIVMNPLFEPLIKWNSSNEQISYKAFREKTNGYMPIDALHFNFKPKELLYQNPKNISPEEFKQEYLKYLT